MHRLHAATPAPDFIMPDMTGNTIRLSDYRGKKILLTFFRYATCPFCTVRFSNMIRETQRYRNQGIQIIGIFESSHAYIQEYIGYRGLAFPVIPDPEGKLYKLYGVKKSLPGLMYGMMRIPTLLRGFFDINYRIAIPDGSLSRIPADFLIDHDQIIFDAYCGGDVGDHIPFKTIDKFATH